MNPNAVNTYNPHSSVIAIYEQGKELGNWEIEIDWSRQDVEEMPEDLYSNAAKVAKGSSYVEQIGMANAALLLQRTDDINLKLPLAQAVLDEARHSEVFLRYAQNALGPIPPGGKAVDELTGHFESIDSFDLIFLSHVYLENLALEQFQIFIEAFDGYLISDLYKGAQKDEARHVALGLQYLREQIQKDSLYKDSIKDHFVEHSDLLDVSDDGCEWMARFSKFTFAEVKSRMERRESRFVDRLLSHY